MLTSRSVVASVWLMFTFQVCLPHFTVANLFRILVWSTVESSSQSFIGLILTLGVRTAKSHSKLTEVFAGKKSVSFEIDFHLGLSARKNPLALNRFLSQAQRAKKSVSFESIFIWDPVYIYNFDLFLKPIGYMYTCLYSKALVYE